MKILSLIFILFLSRSFAENYFEYPTIDFLPQVSIENVCVEEQKLRTIKPIRVCEELGVVARYACRQADQEICRPLKPGQQTLKMEELKEDIQCIKFGLSHFETNREFLLNECAHWSAPYNLDKNSAECLSWIQVTKKHPLIYTVRVISNTGEQGYRLMGVQSFALPLCE